MKNELNEIFALLKNIVACARLGDYSDAASRLNNCLQEIKPILLSGTIPPDYVKKLAYSLETMFLMQKQNDWVAVADVIEFEFVELLKKAPV